MPVSLGISLSIQAVRGVCLKDTKWTGLYRVGWGKKHLRGKRAHGRSFINFHTGEFYSAILPHFEMDSILEWYEITSWQISSSWASSKFWHLILKIFLKLSQTVIQLWVDRGDMPHEICCIYFRGTLPLWVCLISIMKDLTRKWCWCLHTVGQEAQGQKAHGPFAPWPCAFCPTTMGLLPHLIGYLQL